MPDFAIFDEEVMVGVRAMRTTIPKGDHADQFGPLAEEQRHFIRFTIPVRVLGFESPQNGFVFIDRAKAEGRDWLTFCPEYGPVPYAPADPVTNEAISDIFDLAVWAKDRLKAKNGSDL